MTTREETLDFYARPTEMTDAGKYSTLFGRLPGDVDSLARIVQGLVVHEFVASALYGVDISDERRIESDIRPVERMVDRLLAIDDRPLTVARPPERRLVGVCRHYVVLLLAMLRAKHIPARCRSGFGTYFNPGFFEDHVVCEYWKPSDERWVLVDPQFDDVWRGASRIGHDVLDVPRDRFLIAGEAWERCRTGQADPERFGISQGDLRGLWFVAANLVHDLADLNKVEMLRWDVWGAMPSPGAALTDDQLAFFGELAALTREADGSFERVRALYEDDERVRVPATVFNARLNRPEGVDALHV